ncbi:ABC transporter permease [Brucella sp. BE17]|uniref:ABC transporter permease n=1 Tax=Brucella sp. BE17 TaxID=3142977 RepID=UPI0031BAC1D4
MSAVSEILTPRYRRFLKMRLPKASLIVWLCASWLLLMLFVAIFVPFIAPYGFADQSLLNRLKPPVFAGGNWSFLFGTDHLGRDVLSRLLYSIRTSVLIALMGTLIGASIGTLMGFLAAHFRGRVDDAVMILVDFQASVPYLIIALAVLAFLGNSFSLFIVIVGFFGWEVYARLARGLVISINSQGYAGAIRTLGVAPWRIYLLHVLPNILSVLVVQITLNFPDIILLETSLSFLSLGVQPPETSLGLTLGEGRSYIATACWIALPAGIVIFLTTLSISILGDWLRDILNPQER